MFVCPLRYYICFYLCIYIGLLWANYSPIVEELNLEYETTFVQFGLS